jgi:hypothetical protein
LEVVSAGRQGTRRGESERRRRGFEVEGVSGETEGRAQERTVILNRQPASRQASKRTRKRGQGLRRKKLATYASSRDCQGPLPLK